MTKEEAIQRFNGIINAMSISVAQSKFYPSKAELDELCDMAIEALSEPINCVKCKHYYETEDDTDVHGNCRMVEVVRCNNCKWYQGVHSVQGHAPCEWLNKQVLWNDFCSDGEPYKGGDDE